MKKYLFTRNKRIYKFENVDLSLVIIYSMVFSCLLCSPSGLWI